MNIFNHTINDVADFDIPILLAGPIIRRVDKSKICIWISTSKNVRARIKIFRIIKTINGNSRNSRSGSTFNENLSYDRNYTLSDVQQPNLQLIGEGVNSPVQLGDNLFINLIIASPIKRHDDNRDSQSFTNSIEFPTDELLAYDVELISSSTETGQVETITLKDLGLLSGENSIVYGLKKNKDGSLSKSKDSNHDDSNERFYPYPRLPMFYIPDTVSASSLNVLYGSCRKLHGDEEDSLIIGDKIIQDFPYDLAKRPSALFLIGDQIYADDVADPLIDLIKELSTKLLGWEEGIVGLERKLGELVKGDRSEIVSKYAKFSTEVGDNHLLGFGEFAAMYLVAWNQLLWPKRFDQGSTNGNSDSSPPATKYMNEMKELEQSRQSLFGIRRLFANIPTYMICDDHEITDDWNINKKWCDDVEQSTCGKQIISNGLLAYWAFQAWGNDPESFDDEFIQKIKQYLSLTREFSRSISQKYQDLSSTSLQTSGSAKDTVENFKSDQELDYHFIMSRNWTFVAPTYPLSVFLDCRTQRTFVDEEGPPYLLSSSALNHMKNILTKSGYRKTDPLISISPTPVFGFELAESVQYFLTSISGSYKWDLETWRANEMGFVTFLAFLANNFNPSYCIFLSGDVHYAFTMQAHFQRHRPIPNQEIKSSFSSSSETDYDNKIQSAIPVAQLTSSPFRSNSLTNRMVAIWILNLVHRVIVSKKKLFHLKGLVTKNTNKVQRMDYDYFRILPDIYDLKNGIRRIDKYRYSRKQIIHFSRHGNHKSLLEKIKVISFNLVGRHFQATKNERNFMGIPWTEHRLLIKPKGQSTMPVLAKNNIGHVYLDLNSKAVRHTLYFLDKGNIEYSQALVCF